MVPPGKLVRPQLMGPATGAPVLWVTDGQIESPGALWLELSDSSAELGLIPVILDDLQPGTRPGRPWDSGELDPHRNPRPDDLDEAIVFRQRWNTSVPLSLLAPEDRPKIPGRRPQFEEVDYDEEEGAMFSNLVAPWGVGFPGLALAERTGGDPEKRHRTALETPAGRIGLAEAGRAADIPYTIGWIGAVNHFMSETGATPLSVMMRSWEDRFDARLFRLGFGTMEFLVGRPASTESSALALAAEHFAFAGPDGFQAYQPPLYVDSIRTLADVLLERPTWNFWFD